MSTLIIIATQTRGEAKEEAIKMLTKILETIKIEPSQFNRIASMISARGMPSTISEKAAEILIENFVNDEKLGAVCLGLGRSKSPANQAKLRQVIDKTTNRSVKGHAIYALATSMLGRPVAPNEEAEELLEKIVSDFADVETSRGSLAKLAAGPLFEMQNLQIGMAAPNISGEDVDGTAFQLADYKGKVIVLDFWGDW